MLLSNKCGVITGGGSGIGRAICMKFAEHGARLVVADLKKELAEETCRKLKSKECLHSAFKCDVSQSGSVQELRDFVFSRWKTAPHFVVNCAGITQDSTLLKMNENNFDDVLAVNLKGVFLITQAFARLAVECQAKQSVINISSIVGKVGNFGQTNYAATKAGVIGFSKSAAKELASKGIRVNSILPGFIRTPMTAKMPEKVLTSIIKQVPMARMGEVEEVADAALFLASDMSKYVTGATIEVTGGLFM